VIAEGDEDGEEQEGREGAGDEELARLDYRYGVV